MANTTQRDRTPHQLELTKTPWPVAPLNVFISGGMQPGVFDITWDDPSSQALNGNFQIIGVNVYRSHDSEYGPYDRITELPLGATFWRDQTDNVLVIEEDVSDQFLLRGECAGAGQDTPRYVFRTQNSPIVLAGSQKVISHVTDEVRVYVDGVEARVLQVFGATGEVEIDAFYYPEVGTQTMVPPVIPGENSRVTCTYRYTKTFLKTDLATRVFYRVTTVAAPCGCDLSCLSPDELLETPLERAAFTSSYETEKRDYIWNEAVRRNRFILAQGGERVKLFTRKSVGIPCFCIPDEYHKQPLGDCRTCYGTGFIGGYEGPYELMVAPDDAAKKISQRDIGRTVEHTYEVWTGPSPLLSQRDFLVKLNGDRYAVGGVRLPSNRGMVLQQHFNISRLDELDIRYRVPIDNPVKFPGTQFVPTGPEYTAKQGPMTHTGISPERQLKGETVTWKNIMYGGDEK